MNKSKTMIIMFVFLLSIFVFTNLANATLELPEPIVIGKGKIEKDVTLNIDIDPMTISYAQAFKTEEQVLKIIMLAKNETNNYIKPNASYTYSGLNKKSGEKLFERFATSGTLPKIIKPNEIIPLTFTYVGKDKKSFSYIDEIYYDQDFNIITGKPEIDLEISNIYSKNQKLNVTYKNISENDFYDGRDTTIIVLFYNETKNIIGWKVSYLNDALVPGAQREVDMMFGAFLDDYTNQYGQIRQTYLNKINDRQVKFEVIGLPKLKLENRQ